MAIKAVRPSFFIYWDADERRFSGFNQTKNAFRLYPRLSTQICVPFFCFFYVPRGVGTGFMGMKKADYLTGLALILLSIYVLVESWRMPRLEHLQVHPLSIPGIVPAFLAVVLLIFGLILVARSVKAGGHRLGWTRENTKKIFSEPGIQRLQLTAVLTIGYAGILVGRIPYWLATAVFIFVFILVFEWRSGMPAKERSRIGVVAAILAVIVTTAVSYTFERLFLVTLP